MNIFDPRNLINYYPDFIDKWQIISIYWIIDEVLLKMNKR